MSKEQTLSQEIPLQYTGELQPPQEVVKDLNKPVYFPYLPSDDLKEAVNLAIALERPLLLEGEPGCGKTRLAGAVAYEFTHKYLQKDQQGQQKWWNYYIWNIKSTTRARDGLYTYDAIARLRDAQLVGNDLQQLREFIGNVEIKKLQTRLLDKKKYREFGALGNALQEQNNQDKDSINNIAYRPILLIDEIDKADSDFANDLLLELEELRFEIPETEESFHTSKHKPIIFITSNREKPLPEPFLRRCLYFFVKFPERQQLKEIIDSRFGKFENNKEELIQQAITRFYEIRQLLENKPGSRPPGTSEFIEFLTALLNRDDVDKASEDLDNLSKKLPLLGTLLKTKQDQELYQNQKQQR
jgi:MoxR-like ATPase